MTNTEMWGQDLTEVPGFEKEAVRILKQIREEGALAAYKACLK
jgi:tagaturonate reductase